MSKKVSNPFDVYKMPLGLTEGVDVPLPQTDAVFKIKLPSSSNEEYQMALMTVMNVQIDKDDAGVAKPLININPAEFQQRQKKLFFSSCIIGCSGLPDDMDASAFFAAYPLAAKYLFDIAQEMAQTADEAVEASLGKFKPSQNGKDSGKANSINTPH